MRGLTLLEVVVALGILALVAFSVLTTYTGLLAGTRQANVNRDAVAALDTLLDLWTARVRSQWPASDLPLATVDGTFRGYVYHVDDFGKLANPLRAGEKLQLRRLRLRLDFAHDGQAQSLSSSFTVSQ